jgi:hypothetical protein
VTERYYTVAWALNSGTMLYLHHDGMFYDCDCEHIWWTYSRVRAMRRACTLDLAVAFVDGQQCEGREV